MKLLGLVFVFALACSAQTCTCAGGRVLEAGLVRYGGNSGRESIERIAADPHSRRCNQIWIASTEIRAVGTPYQFHLERIRLREHRFDGCDFPADDFVSRDKRYLFAFDADSTSLRELRSAVRPNPAPDKQAQSNRNLWDSIFVDPSRGRRTPRRDIPAINPAREFNRTSWVVARRALRARCVGRFKDAGQNERIVALTKTRSVHASEVGQIEAVRDGYAIVRFYEGSRAGGRTGLRRWYASAGGPYREIKGDLYTAIRAEIVEISIDDIVEINEYLDQQKKDTM